MTINNVRIVDPIVKTIKNTTRDNLLGYIVIKQDCKIRYGNLILGPENKYARGQVSYFSMSLEAAKKSDKRKKVPV